MRTYDWRGRGTYAGSRLNAVLELLSGAASAITPIDSRRCLRVAVTSKDWCMSKESQI